MTPEETLATREAIVRKGLRLQIATELLAACVAHRGLGSTGEAALEQADALIRENEAMP